MQSQPSNPNSSTTEQPTPAEVEAKPVTDWWKPEMVELPKLPLWRILFRKWLHVMLKLVTLVNMSASYRGLENFPKKGPIIFVFNHLGNDDMVLMASKMPYQIEAVAKIELNEEKLIGPVFRAYGFIWVHRGQPDRRAIRAMLECLAEGRMLIIAPEGRQSVTGALEEGTEGAAFLAVKSGAAIVPIAITGTEIARIESYRAQRKRAPVSMAVGKPFHLTEYPTREETIRKGTHEIMLSLARLLPEEYQGIYRDEVRGRKVNV